MRARGVVVERGGRRILRGVDVAVELGELVAVIGPNGAGKSTLLGVLAGDVALADGKVELDGRPLSGYDRVELARRRAVVLQEAPAAAALDFRVGEVVRLGRAPHGTEPTERGRARAERTLAEVGLPAAEFGHRRFSTLSGGERQRVVLARALVQIDGVAGGVLLLDEPTASLDVAHAHLILDRARERARRGGRVLAVLHELNLAFAYADRVMVLAGGQRVACGPPGEVGCPRLLESVYGTPFERLATARAPGFVVV